MLQRKVFVASTARDLREWRKLVIEAVDGLDGYQPICMERFGSRDAVADDFCLEQVAQCDLFIGIIGHLYGNCPPDSSESYTYREYKEAKKRGKPRLMFVADQDFPMPANLLDRLGEHKQQQQQAFRKQVDEEVIRIKFKSPADLVTKVLQAIHNWHQKSLTDRAERRANTLASLTRLYILEANDLSGTFGTITEALAQTLDVERVSIWRYTKDRSAIRCHDLYILSRQQHDSSADLEVTSYPCYFRALETSEVLDAEDARTDPRTREFLNDYLLKHGIVSMMDVPIHLSERLGGVVCHEHTGQKRKWTSDEKTFAIAVANIVSLAIERFVQRDSTNL
ncbi:MAG TPA: DUF4062 domain-containing protein [Pyrinomonadaceae bacterium]|jgi:hypothetical protein